MTKKGKSDKYRPITAFEQSVFLYLHMLAKINKKDVYGCESSIANSFLISLERAQYLLILWIINFREDGNYKLVYIPTSPKV
ncbi:hypothetical protein [Tamlana sp. I1]|uniref:hypothetical protein n=1 Tax=Tamlana sp. I1 TaxID=2762061 RepID=UPI00188F74F0|nr:hypothetical protein [Tamlana sp. I1]